jgi:hypothetical protein
MHLKIIKNEIKLRNLWLPKVKGSKTQKKEKHYQQLQKPVPKHQKNSLYVCCSTAIRVQT